MQRGRSGVALEEIGKDGRAEGRTYHQGYLRGTQISLVEEYHPQRPQNSQRLPPQRTSQNC